jgi:hypothetical protein
VNALSFNTQLWWCQGLLRFQNHGRLVKYQFYNLFATSMIIACCYSGFLFWSDNLSLHHAKFPSIITRAPTQVFFNNIWTMLYSLTQGLMQ